MAGEVDWREELRTIDPAIARGPVTALCAELLLAKGRREAAVSAYRELHARFPENVTFLIGFGRLLQRMGRTEEAVQVLNRAGQLEAANYAELAEDRTAVGDFLSAAETRESLPAAAPDAFVTSLFDRSAIDFDSLLRISLSYRGPEILFDAVGRAAGRPLQNLDVLDLGCGTGLAGELFRPLARRLDGVDLSPKMLEHAAKRGYDRLTAANLVTHLSGIENEFDLVLAADVFVYLGDLAPAFAGVYRALRPGGWLAFTVEAGAEDGITFCLQANRRYNHSRGYLSAAFATAGFEVLLLEATTVRTEATLPVRSFVCVATR